MILKWNACFLSGFLCSFEKQTLDSTDSRASVFPWYTIYLHTFRIDFGIERRGQLRNDEEWATEFDLWIQVKTIQDAFNAICVKAASNIAPLVTLGNWKREIETWTTMNFLAYHDSEGGSEIFSFIREAPSPRVRGLFTLNQKDQLRAQMLLLKFTASDETVPSREDGSSIKSALDAKPKRRCGQNAGKAKINYAEKEMEFDIEVSGEEKKKKRMHGAGRESAESDDRKGPLTGKIVSFDL
ncbi:hypothetical protein ABG067_002920 [Albugo candida]